MTVRIQGYVRGAPRLQPVIGAKISFKGLNGTRCNTNHEGAFAIHVPPGEYTLLVEASGWQRRELSIAAFANLRVDFLLNQEH